MAEETHQKAVYDDIANRGGSILIFTYLRLKIVQTSRSKAAEDHAGRNEMEADEQSSKLEEEKLKDVLDGQHEYRVSRETTDEDTNPLEELEYGTERSNSPGFQIGVLR
ncbi:hypothetical protein C0993_010926 [Termitomyces sp. T159_Od127]|nr:hypothetical protein C0993_010926 [Termitomyces sp. T159_Od127]